MKRLLLSAHLVSSFVFFAGGCGVEATPPGEEIGSDKARITTPAPAGDLAAVVAGQNDLGFRLLREVGSEANLFISPLSISTALSMSYAGAAGETSDAFYAVLGSALSEAAHHRAMNQLDRELGARGQTAQGADGKPFRLQRANQLFGQVGASFEHPFLDTLAEEYGAKLRALDFVTKAEPSREAINAWVAARTEDRIHELLGPGSITPDTRLVLVNAIYFNAAWKFAFAERDTATGTFTTRAGAAKSVPFMRKGQLSVRAATVDGVEVVELPYDGDELSMLVMMPKAGEHEAFEAGLSSAGVDALVDALAPELLDLQLPKFEARTSASLVAPLSKFGLERAFSAGADFSRITRSEALVISDVIHEAFVKVNESGTEAAAATAVTFERTSAPQVRALTIDRPFVFVIRDQATRAIVFVGRIGEP